MMKKTILIIMVLTAGRACAIAPIGPAASVLDEGQVELGFDYAGYRLDGLPMDFTAEAFGFSISEELPVDDDIDGYWAKLTGSPVDEVDLFVRLGKAGFASGEPTFSWGWGGRVTIVESGPLAWGIIAQGTYFGTEYEETIADPTIGPVSLSADVGIFAGQIAAGPVYTLDGLCLYGGPFLYYLHGDGDFDATAGDYSVPGTVELESDTQLGVYAGLSVDLTEALAVYGEAQIIEDATAICCGLTWRF